MLCPRCSREELKVVKTRRGVTVEGRESASADSRIVTCLNCALQFVTESRIKFINEWDGRKKIRVSYEDYRAKLLSKVEL